MSDGYRVARDTVDDLYKMAHKNERDIAVILERDTNEKEVINEIKTKVAHMEEQIQVNQMNFEQVSTKVDSVDTNTTLILNKLTSMESSPEKKSAGLNFKDQKTLIIGGVVLGLILAGSSVNDIIELIGKMF